MLQGEEAWLWLPSVPLEPCSWQLLQAEVLLGLPPGRRTLRRHVPYVGSDECCKWQVIPRGSLQETSPVIKNNACETTYGLCHKELPFLLTACPNQDDEGKILTADRFRGQGGGFIPQGNYLHLLSPATRPGTFWQRGCLGKFLGNWKK